MSPILGSISEMDGDTQARLRNSPAFEAGHQATILETLMTFKRNSILLGAAALLSVQALTGCGGSEKEFAPSNVSAGVSIGGSLSGLADSESVSLVLNGQVLRTLSANGAYTFPEALPVNSSYTVTVWQQPAGQTCSAANATGAGVTADVNNVAVTCSQITYPVGGTVSGLIDGATLMLANNGSALPIAANGAFTFDGPVNYNGAYAVTVASQPEGQVCTVSDGRGVGVTDAVTNVSVQCSSTPYGASGTVAGLPSGTQVTLMNNGADPVVVAANGSFTFNTPVSLGGGYLVTVNQQPRGQTCTVSGYGGRNVAAAISDLSVNCASAGYAIGGMLSGLASGAQITLRNNGADDLVLTANGGFTFPTPVVPSGTYEVSVNQRPTGQTCSIASGSGTASADVMTVAVNCSSAPTLTGNLLGLPEGVSVTISDSANGGVSTVVSGPSPVSYSLTEPASAVGGSYTILGTSSDVNPSWMCDSTTDTARYGRYSGATGSIQDGTNTAPELTCYVPVNVRFTFQRNGYSRLDTSGRKIAFTVNDGPSIAAITDPELLFTTPIAFGTSHFDIGSYGSYGNVEYRGYIYLRPGQSFEVTPSFGSTSNCTVTSDGGGNSYTNSGTSISFPSVSSNSSSIDITCP